MKYGLIGEKLGHSFSKAIHERLGYEYELCEIPRDKLDDFMRKRDFVAINVTIPYKEKVIPYLDEIDDGAKKIGAVNTIVNRGGKLYGYNTDFYGMRDLFFHADIYPKGKKVAILGSGGTSRTAMAVLKSLDAGEAIVVSRSGDISYDDLYKKHADVEIIVNTTPVGMYPDVFGAPVELKSFKKLSGVIDVVYNPLNTTIVNEAKTLGIKAEAGLYMLVKQALYASELFIGTKHPAFMMDVIYDGIKAEKENIVLIGMPSSGKSTVGRLLADKLGNVFVDTDELIVEKIKMPIKDFFTLHGEESFRDIESQIIREISGQNSLVIATGGGAILREENVSALKRNGKIIFLDRSLNNLVPTDSRPLSSDHEALQKRYDERFPIYCGCCDIHVNGDGDAISVANNILENYL